MQVMILDLSASRLTEGYRGADKDGSLTIARQNGRALA